MQHLRFAFDHPVIRRNLLAMKSLDPLNRQIDRLAQRGINRTAPRDDSHLGRGDRHSVEPLDDAARGEVTFAANLLDDSPRNQLGGTLRAGAVPFDARDRRVCNPAG